MNDDESYTLACPQYALIFVHNLISLRARFHLVISVDSRCTSASSYSPFARRTAGEES